ncbi:hypothetical protein BH10ACI1_BH10ACI1_15900 [soil metagenome]
MTHEKSTPETKKLEGNAIIERLLKISFLFALTAILFILIPSVSAQNTSQNVGSDHTADKNLKSMARVNPSTLAMEFSVPFMNYPGRSGNSLPFGVSYSSKVWRMDDQFNSYSYPLPYSCNRQYVSQLIPKF